MKRFLKEKWSEFVCTFFHRAHHFSYDGGYWIGPFTIITGNCECKKCGKKFFIE